MKKYVFIILAVTTMPQKIAIAAQVATCITIEDFSNTCNSNQYCCPNNDYIMEYSCPSGYTLSGTQCKRSASTGRDTSGTYTVTYDTCAAQQIKKLCCKISISASNSCYVCMNQNKI